MARSASWDLDLERRIGVAMGAEVRGLGHNLLLAPCVNTLRHPGWGRSQETYGEDPWLLGKMGAAFTQGTQTQVPACVKHMAGNNIEDTRMTNDAIIDEQNLRENYMRQYRMVIEEADVACVMSAYNQVNGAYSSENQHLLTNILRDEWGYDGFVVSDWFATKSTVESALAGLDVEMPWRAHYAGLELAVDSGQVSEEIIDKAVERILRIKFKFGFALLNETYAGDPNVVESPEHIALALEAAHKGTVLLKNEGSALPLSRDDGKTIAVVGEWSKIARLGDNGSSRVDPSYAIDPYTGIKARAGDGVTVVQSEDSSAAQGADVVIVVAALTQQDEGEAWNGGGDRYTLDLSSADEALINAVAQMADTVIVIIEAGGPITMNAWKDSADAIVMAWYPGMEGGHALGDLIFGDINFSGRLTQTWPKTWDDEPLFGNDQATTVFEYLHGYRHFDGNEIEPLFPFGFGLSYTSFEYSNLSTPCAAVTPGAIVEVSFDVKNSGEVAGADVPQLYVAYPNTTVRRPIKELKGFARVELEPGETQRVTIALRVSDLAYYDADQSAWVVEKLEHMLHIGSNATELVLSAPILVDSDGLAHPAPEANSGEERP
jgi:beta-glucosidase